MIDCFINENANLYLIDEVCIYHLARHFSEPIELLPLKDLLLTENAFSAFLAENNIVFKENNGQLELYYKQQLIKPQDLLSDRHHLLLAKRLGYFSEADYCINGFAFWPDIEETSDGYYEELRISPEFIRKIGDFLDIDLCREYAARTKYYGIVFIAKLNEITFDGNKNMITKEEKALYLLRCSLLTLHSHYFDCPSSLYNPMIRIDDTAKAKVHHCILINE